MSTPPTLLRVNVASPGRRPFRLWLPLFLLWPLALVLGVLALALAALADVVLALAGRRYHRATLLLARGFATFGALPGTAIRISNDKSVTEIIVH